MPPRLGARFPTAALRRTLLVLLGVYLIVLALGLLRLGITAVNPLFERFVDDVASAVGLGWLSACLLLSGSPAAAIALTFLEQGTIDRFQTLGMVTGSRLGSCFVVLLVGFLHDLRSRQQGRTAYIGVAGVFVTASLCVPALFLGLALLRSEAVLAALDVQASGAAASILDPFLEPVLGLFRAALPVPLLFVAGVGVLLAAFKVFDLALPDVSGAGERFDPVGSVLYRPGVMFFLGLLVTTLTLSVSVSLTVLVPLTAKGYVRRENLFPYMMGANISTFVDTLFISLVVASPEAFAVVAVLMACVTVVALPIVFLLLRRYERLVDRATRACIHGYRNLFVFVVLLFLVPLILVIR